MKSRTLFLTVLGLAVVFAVLFFLGAPQAQAMSTVHTNVTAPPISYVSVPGVWLLPVNGTTIRTRVPLLKWTASRGFNPYTMHYEVQLLTKSSTGKYNFVFKDPLCPSPTPNSNPNLISCGVRHSQNATSLLGTRSLPRYQVTQMDTILDNGTTHKGLEFGTKYFGHARACTSVDSSACTGWSVLGNFTVYKP